ncbi:MAG: S8 family serine peptidase [Planctomycetes bacterium]|nr:S8 family serine peptidase [Planctomycetota bacterium]
MKPKSNGPPNSRILWIIGIAITGLALPSEGGPNPRRAQADVAVRPEPAQFHPSRLLVRFKQAASVAGNGAVERIRPGHRVVRPVRAVANLLVVEVPSGTVQEALASYRADPNVLYAEPDFVVHTTAVPNDPGFSFLWGLQNAGQTVNGDPGTAGADVGVTAGWDVWTGGVGFRIAVIDTGIDLNHPDLRANLWINFLEIPGNGIDDDGNGWVDDVYGFNTVAGSGDPMDTVGHGTHIAGTIGAVSNNGLGVAGLNWHCKLVALKFTNEEGEGFISDAITALQYVIDNGIKVSNNSWGCYECFSQALYDTIAASQAIGHVFVAAAGNGIFGLGVDTDLFPFYPASFDLPNVIAVAATDNDDRKAKFSNFGRLSIDIGAPGVNIYSTVTGAGYGFASGTSMATAHVTGAVGLLMSRRNVPWQEVRERLFSVVRPLDSLLGLTTTGGVLNAAAAAGDCNHNGMLDELDLTLGTSDDCNDNGVPDECEPDCNDNQVADRCDTRDGTSDDCNANGVPDECEPDCNGNNRADSCDLTLGASDDCNENGVPDECEPAWDWDCNTNQQADLCDLFDGTSRDCNGNHLPDECDIAGGVSEDCSGNGLPDECERDCNDNRIADSCDILNGTSQDDDADGVPDECVLGFALIPVAASGDFTVQESEIFILEGGSRVTFEIQLSGWDPDQDGDPRLYLYQVEIDGAGFLSGSEGFLSLAQVPCLDNDDCVGDSVCQASGFCNAEGSLNVDESHPAFLFSELPTISVSSPLGLRMGSLVFNLEDAAVDLGVDVYVGTLVLDVSTDAWGTFTVALSPTGSFLQDDSKGSNLIAVRGFRPALVTILADCNGNSVLDEHDIRDGTSQDCDGDGVPDECVDPNNDCNGNTVPDVCDTTNGTSRDCNGNGIPDECIELEADCNNNGIPDMCDINGGFSTDCNHNRIPDDCIHLEQDCNTNAIPDFCDIEVGASGDCNANGMPDECELDCNANDSPDDCDLEAGTSRDLDENGIPDECQRTLRVPDEYETIQEALDAAGTGDVVLVADGTYSGPGNAEIDFRGKAITLRSENGPDRCTIDATDMNIGVVFVSGETPASRLEGFTIAHARVCGVFCAGSGPTIRRCIVRNNGPVGTGIYCFMRGDPIISDCTITRNSAGFSGGGIFCDQSSPTITGCTITQNTARNDGGGIFAFVSNLTIRDSIISGNFARGRGGGIFVIGGHPVIRESWIKGNTIRTSDANVGSGGGIHLLRSEALVANCLVTGNAAKVNGGGVYLESGNPVIANSTILGNAARAGGGVYQAGGEGDAFACCHTGICENNIVELQCDNLGGTWYPGLLCTDVECGTQSCCLEDGSCEDKTVLDCLAAGGRLTGVGTQCSVADCTPTVTNSILWMNLAAVGHSIESGALTASVVHSTVSGGWPGDGNSSDAPLFVTPGYWSGPGVWTDGDYHLLFESPEIDGGSEEFLPVGIGTDYDGHARILCGGVDRGAYEHGIGDFDCNGVVDLSDFLRWPECFTGLNVAAQAEGCGAFDYDADGDVDLKDYAGFQNTAAHSNPE